MQSSYIYILNNILNYAAVVTDNQTNDSAKLFRFLQKNTPLK